MAIGTWAMAPSEIDAGRWAEGATTWKRWCRLAPHHHSMIRLQQAPTDRGRATAGPQLPQDIFDSFVHFGGIAAAWTLALLAPSRVLVSQDADAVVVAAYEEAIAHDANSGWRFEEARTRLVAGECMRRRSSAWQSALAAKRDRHLRAARRAPDLGRSPRTELRTTGETPRKQNPNTLDQLTLRKQIVRRVAEDAKQKRSQLSSFHQPRTVAYHLRNVFAKLGISLGAELIRLPDFDECAHGTS